MIILIMSVSNDLYLLPISYSFVNCYLVYFKERLLGLPI